MLVRALLALLALAALGVATLWLGLRRDGFLERRVSSAVARRPGEHLAFDGILPNADLSLELGDVRYRRPGLWAEAEVVTVAPDFKSALKARSFSIRNGTVRSPPWSLSALSVRANLLSSPPAAPHWSVLATGVSSGPFLRSGPCSARVLLRPERTEVLELRPCPGVLAQGAGVLSAGRYVLVTGSLAVDPGSLPELAPATGVRVTPLCGAVEFRAELRPGGLRGAALTARHRGLGVRVAAAPGTFDVRASDGGLTVTSGALEMDPVTLEVSGTVPETVPVEVAGRLDFVARTGSIALRAPALPTGVVAALAPRRLRSLLALSPATSTLELSLDATWSSTGVRGRAEAVPRGLVLDAPLARSRLCARVASGGLVAEAGPTLDARFEPPLVLDTGSALLEVRGSFRDLGRSGTCDLLVSSDHLPFTTVLEWFVRPRERARLQGWSPVGSVSLTASLTGPANRPVVDADMSIERVVFTPPGGATATAPAVEVRGGRLTRSSAGYLTWRGLDLAAGGATATLDGTVLDPRTGGSFRDVSLQARAPLAALVALASRAGRLGATGDARLSLAVEGPTTAPLASGTLELPGPFAVELRSGSRPFNLDGADLRASLRLAGDRLMLEGLVAHLLGGQLAGEVTARLGVAPAVERFAVALGGVEVDGLVGRFGGPRGLLGGRVGFRAAGGQTAAGAPEGRGDLATEDATLDAGRLVEVAGWGRYFPDPERPKGWRDRVLNVVLDAAARHSRVGQSVVAVRDALRGSYRFGRIQAAVAVAGGVARVAPLNTLGGPSTLAGRLAIDLESRRLEGLVSATLVHGTTTLTVRDVALGGTADHPTFELTRSVAETFSLSTGR